MFLRKFHDDVGKKRAPGEEALEQRSPAACGQTGPTAGFGIFKVKLDDIGFGLHCVLEGGLDFLCIALYLLKHEVSIEEG